MKKSSKSSSKRTRRSRSRSPEAKSKVLKSRSRSKEREVTKEVKDKEKASRKSRWQSEAATENTTPVTVTVEGAPQRIRDLVDDKEKLVEYLFLTVTGTALEELIPDYLKKCSVEDLKKLCTEQIKDMSRECIISVISGSQPERNEDTPPLPVKQPIHVASPSLSETASEDVLELSASVSEMKGVITDEENMTPTPTEEESEDMPLPESDVDLLELEMRARAIRSLLKARNQESADSDVNE